ncbi:hypothetical protein SLS62_005640 [Diatrype stigma]|uniref:Rhodopsin domain-containing protein n=1 Tax=Diatrype stigma TaxID=117547 RepID=A0AAN9UUC8_9PEZI
MVLYADHAPNLAAAVITICIFAYISFGLRVYTRIKYSLWGSEDWTMTAAITGVGATNATLALPGNEEYQMKGLFWFFLFEVFYCINIIPVKISISLMLLRIAQNLTAGLYIIFRLTVDTECDPVSAAWDTSSLANGGKCNDPVILADVYYATTAVNIFTDWVTAFMPVPLLWNIQMNVNSKASVAFILGLGFFASLSACVRLKYTVGLTSADNYLYSISDIVIWGYAENGLGLLVGCISTLRPLFRKVFRLGGGSSYPTPSAFPKEGSRYAFPGGNSRRAYTEFGPSYELDSPKDYDKDTMANSTRIRGGDDGNSSDSESQKQILQAAKDPAGIYVSREVHISGQH